MQMLRDAGFQQVTKVPTDGQRESSPRLDAGAPKTLGLYFMYDVKQVDPLNGHHRRGKHALWTSRDSAKSWSAAVR